MCAFSLINISPGRLFLFISSNSLINTSGSITVPDPIKFFVPSHPTPQGTRCKANLPNLFSIVWPALFPPEYLAITSAFSAI